jgi:transcriptional regulator with XRE-family HTH domain
MRTDSRVHARFRAERSTLSENLLTRVEVGARLKAERQRLGLNQAVFAGLATVSRRTQASYEAGDGAPSADYLAAMADAGVDVLYVVTGRSWVDKVALDGTDEWPVPAVDSLASEERELLSSFRRMHPSDRMALRQIAGSLARPQDSSKSLGGPA